MEDYSGVAVEVRDNLPCRMLVPGVRQGPFVLVTRGAIALALCANGCSAPAESEAIGGVARPIVGGQATPTCAWPTTVHFQQSSGRTSLACSATLIHPKVISIAAHCVDGTGTREIAFGDTDDHRAAARRVSVTSCTQRPDWQNANEDFAFCILSQEVNDVPIVPVLFGCEEQILRPGAPVVLVGFGNIDDNTPSPQGHKRSVETTVDAFPRDRRTIDLGDATHTQCNGDGGGPAFVKLADGSWRVFGAASTIAAGSCASPGTWAYVPHYIAWAEQTSGLDLTPCHDAATGRWNPGPGCTSVPLNPDVSDGTWAKMCTEKLVTSGPSSSCGPPIDAGVSMPDAATAARDARLDVAPGESDGSADGSAGSSGAGGASGKGGDAGTGGTGGDDPTGSGGDGSGSGGTYETVGGSAGFFRPVRGSNQNQIGTCTCRVAPGARSSARDTAIFAAGAFGLFACFGARSRKSSRRRREAPSTRRSC